MNNHRNNLIISSIFFQIINYSGSLGLFFKKCSKLFVFSTKLSSSTYKRFLLDLTIINNKAKRESEESALILLKACLISTILILPLMVSAYFFENGSQSMFQLIINRNILMIEDFDELTPPQNPPGWSQIDGNWTTCYDGGNVVYQQDDESDKKALTIATTYNETWYNFTYHVRLKFITGNDKKPDAGALLIFRYVNGNTYYYLRIEQYSDSMKLYEKGGEGEGLLRGSANIVVDEGVWYSFKIRIDGQIVNVWVDDIPYLTNIDMRGSIKSGQVGVGTRYYKCYFDDIMVTED